jgi:biopolymer transport protein ExbD
MVMSGHKKGLENSLIPMINLIFILLIFFLLVSKIKPIQSIDVIPPTTMQELVSAEIKIQVDPAGKTFFYNLRNPSQRVLKLSDLPKNTLLLVSVDRDSKASKLTKLIRRLSVEGYTNISILAIKK